MLLEHYHHVYENSARRNRAVSDRRSSRLLSMQPLASHFCLKRFVRAARALIIPLFNIHRPASLPPYWFYRAHSRRSRISASWVELIADQALTEWHRASIWRRGEKHEFEPPSVSPDNEPKRYASLMHKKSIAHCRLSRNFANGRARWSIS